MIVGRILGIIPGFQQIDARGPAGLVHQFAGTQEESPVSYLQSSITRLSISYSSINYEQVKTKTKQERRRHLQTP